MSNLAILSVAFLCWTLLTTFLMRVQLVVAPVQQAPVPSFRTMPIRTTVAGPVSVANIIYN